MKTKLFLLALAATVPLYAQDFVAPTQKPHEISPVEVVQPKPTIDGIVKEIFVTKKPWQLVNPAAPASYGTGEKLVSRDTGPGTPFHSTGLVVVGVEW
jgi:hypothetical protein